MKAQAVLARTYVYRIVDPGIGGRPRTIREVRSPGTDSGAGAAGWGKRSRTLDRDLMEEELDIDCLSVREMEKKWGNEHFEEYYEKVRRAVRETEGLVAEYDGELIEPFYCLASAGKRESWRRIRIFLLWRVRGIWKRMDFYMSGRSRKDEFADRIGRIGGPQPAADGIAEKIQIIERDSAGYVKRAQIGNMDYTGDEVRDSLGLSSSCFYFSSADGKIRVSSKGIGSGYGFAGWGGRHGERAGECVSGTAEILFPGDRNREDRGVEDLAGMCRGICSVVSFVRSVRQMCRLAELSQNFLLL